MQSLRIFHVNPPQMRNPGSGGLSTPSRDEFAPCVAGHLGDLRLRIVRRLSFSEGTATVLAMAAPNRLDMATEHSNRYATGMHWQHDPVLTAANASCGSNSVVLVRVDPMKVDDPVLRNDFYVPPERATSCRCAQDGVTRSLP